MTCNKPELLRIVAQADCCLGRLAGQRAAWAAGPDDLKNLYVMLALHRSAAKLSNSIFLNVTISD
jgi:hypothetical protein